MSSLHKPEYTFQVQLGRYDASFIGGEFADIGPHPEHSRLPEVRNMRAWWQTGAHWNGNTGKLLVDHHELTKLIGAAHGLAVPCVVDEYRFWLEWAKIFNCIDPKTAKLMNIKEIYEYALRLVAFDLAGQDDEFAPTAHDKFLADTSRGTDEVSSFRISSKCIK